MTEQKLYQVNDEALENTCPFAETKLEKLDTPARIPETDNYLHEMTIHYCNHLDQKDERKCILYYGEICNWLKKETKKEK
jgi:hypothetical protein